MRLAEEFDAEIVNADAFCLYRGMDIGTAKPSADDRLRVRHHLIDTHEVDEPVDVVWYQSHARVAIGQIWDRGRLPLLVGGSGLYVQSVLDDLRFPGTDPEVRSHLEAQLGALGPEAMHERLRAVDPQAAARILPSNGRRIVRALEVNEITGGPFAATLPAHAEWCTAVRIGWDPGVEALDRAIAQRVDRMWAEGLVAEVRELLPALRDARTASRAVGYRQIMAALAEGRDPDTAHEPTIVATRRLARRQRSWFGRDSRVRWVDTPSQAARILGTLET